MENTLTLYLKSISAFPLLSAEQEKELGRRYKDEGDLTAREQLINSNLRLVVSVAKSYRNGNHNISLEDLIAEGNTGLMTAVDKFDYTRGFRFSTCAVPWIKQAITKSILDNSRAIRVPAHIVQKFNQYRNVRDKLIEEKGTENPTLGEIANGMGIEVAELQQLLQWKQNTASLDTPVGDEEDTTLGDLCADDAETPAEYTDRADRQGFIMRIINELDPRTRNIFKLRFGLGDDNDPEEYHTEHTLEEIGGLLKPAITRERVRQIINNQIAKWRTTYGDRLSFLMD